MAQIQITQQALMLGQNSNMDSGLQAVGFLKDGGLQLGGIPAMPGSPSSSIGNQKRERHMSETLGSVGSSDGSLKENHRPVDNNNSSDLNPYKMEINGNCHPEKQKNFAVPNYYQKN